MRPGLLSLILAAALGAGGGLSAAQDNDGRYLPQVSAPSDEAAAKPQAKNPPAKPRAAAAKSAVNGKATAATGPAAATADPLADIAFDQRADIRAALLWSAGEEAARGGDQIAAAIAAFRKRNKSNAQGPLTEREREMLLAAARARDEEFGWQVVTDPATGIRLGLPTKMVPNARLADRGTRWSSRHGDIQVETFRFRTDEPLGAVFARMKSEPANRKVEYSAARADNFIISGLQGLRKFSVRAYLRDGEVRGFTMQFDQAMEGIVAPVMVAMASAFAPFPARIAPLASLSRTVVYGTGIVVSADGHILTNLKLTDDCRSVIVAGIGNAEPVAHDNDSGLALLRVYGRHKLTPAAFAPAAAGNDLTLVGVPDPHIQNGGGKAAELKARLHGADTIELKEPMPVAGFSGGAALDTQGRIAGMMETSNAMPAGMQLASVSPAVAAPPVRLVSAATIGKFLAANKIAMAEHGAAAQSCIVRIICVRR